MSMSEIVRALAEKTPEEIQAEADVMAGQEAEVDEWVAKRDAEPFSIERESDLIAWRIKSWCDKGADIKFVTAVIAAGFVKAFASKGYVLKIKTEKLF